VGSSVVMCVMSLLWRTIRLQEPEARSRVDQDQRVHETAPRPQSDDPHSFEQRTKRTEPSAARGVSNDEAEQVIGWRPRQLLALVLKPSALPQIK